ncbi:MAG: hypothetical protein LBF77_11405 [Spirochaetaceae bacterium]|jgi:hypothetical protein|nr:hypothetical protein [Spirochaetaceae bacterium]
MLVLKGVLKEEIRKLKIGDFFIDSEIVNIQRKSNLISIITRAGGVFNAHEKQRTFNVFKRIKRLPENRGDAE